MHADDAACPPLLAIDLAESQLAQLSEALSTERQTHQRALIEQASELTGKHAADYANAYFGKPENTFKRAGKMPDFRGRLLPFWEWPWAIDGEVFGGKGLQDQNLFPYNIYRMLGGMRFERIDIK